MVKEFLSYLHFVGVIPAFFVVASHQDEPSVFGFILSIIFSWGFVLAELVDKFLI